MAGKLPMGQKELLRAKIMEMVKQKQKTLKEASIILKVSYRQVKRIYRAYKKNGDKGLIHGNTNKISNNKFNADFKEEVLKRYQERYYDFGPTFASEKLSEDGYVLDHETLRRWLSAKGLWKQKRIRNIHRLRRERKECFGELIQFDGSHHDWFEGRAPKCCLMNMVDDATGLTFSFFSEQETTESAMILLWEWIKRYGIPQALYCDRKNAFVIDREPTIEEQIANIFPKSPFEKSCDKLGVEVKTAYSPEAKGRVERNHAVYQDRLVKELRLRNISSISEANEYLKNEYLGKINDKFKKEPKIGEDAHVPLLNEKIDLKDIFCFEETRVVTNDYVIQYENECYQITKENKNIPRAKSKVIVRKLLDKSIHVIWNDKKLLVEKIDFNKERKEKPVTLSA
jgi:transposase